MISLPVNIAKSVKKLITEIHVLESIFLVVRALVLERWIPDIRTHHVVRWIAKPTMSSANVKKVTPGLVVTSAPTITLAIRMYRADNVDLANVATTSIFLDRATAMDGRANVSNVSSTLKVLAVKSVRKDSLVMLLPSNVLPAFVIRWAASLQRMDLQFVTIRRANVLVYQTLKVCLAIVVPSTTGKSHPEKDANLAVAILSVPFPPNVTNTTASASVAMDLAVVDVTNVVPTTGVTRQTTLAGHVCAIRTVPLPNNATMPLAPASVYPEWVERNATDALADTSEQSFPTVNLVANVSTIGIESSRYIYIYI